MTNNPKKNAAYKNKDDEMRFTVSGMPIKPVYTSEDAKNESPKPGEYPFTRGLYPTMYRTTPWATLEVSGFGLPEETNARQKYLIAQGQLHYFGHPGIHLCFDLATQYGYDSDHPLAQYDVGKCGTIIDSLADMERVLDGLPVADMHISMINNPTGPILTAMLAAYAEKQGIPWSKISGSINNCSIVGPISDNMITLPLRPTLRLMMDVVKFSTNEMPNLHPITFHMYSCRERGATAIQELAYGMAAGVCVVKEGIKMGLPVDSFAPNLVFFFSLNNNFFEEIAKLRAARKIWARIMKEKFGAKNPQSWKCQLLSQTAGSTLTSQEPLNNVARVAIQALAGVLGGVQAMHTCSYDEALDIPTDEAVRVAVKTQRIIEYETGVTDVADPLGGSYFVEALTDQIEKTANDLLKNIEDMGGYITALEKGYLQSEIDKSARKLQHEIDSGERIVVGLNKFVLKEQEPIETFDYNPEVRKTTLERLHKLKEERDNQRVKDSLAKLKKAVLDDGYLMPVIIEAVKEYTTLGEIMNVFREVYGEYREESFLKASTC